jgi:two-component system NtrC family sensor kinase
MVVWPDKMPLLDLGADMARPSRTGGKTSGAKARNASAAKGRKTTKAKRHIAPAATRVKRRSVSGPSKDLKEAREQQAATAEILKVIASSPNDVQPVFEAIMANADRLIGGFSTAVYRFVDRMVHLASFTPINPASDELMKRRFPRPIADTPYFALAQAGETVEIPDTEIQPDMDLIEIARARGIRSLLYSPLLSKGAAIGVIVVTRRNPGPFSAHHVELLRTFAAQAVIAIQNARLFNETREALERQTATADILKVIASSPSDVQPVFEAIVGSAKRLLSGHGASLYRVVDGMLHLEAFTPFNPEADEVLRKSFPVTSSDYPPLALVARGASFQFADTEKDAPEFQTRIARLRGFRSILLTPLIHNGTTTGLVMVTRAETGSFADNHVRLMKTFADQAVIAIENTRLFNMVRQRTDDLSEALQQQTATADVLKVIASSPTDVGPTLRAIVEGACRFCDAYDATVLLKIEDHLHYSAHHGPIPVPREAHRITRQWVAGRSVVDKVPVQISDFLAPEAAAEFPEGQRRALEQGHRCTLAIPLLQEGEAVGAIGLRRLEPVAFSTKQVRLLQTFADQAVIAIENTRLFDELRQSLQQQTATADVLKVISRSSVDLETVLNTLVGTVARLCRADQAFMFRRHADGLHHLIAVHGLSEEAKAYVENNPFAPDRGATSGRVALERRPIHIPDVLADPDYTYMGGQLAAGFRTLLGLPLLREDTLIGVFVIGRTRVDPFTNKEIELATSFADQAVIAIENARLFEELRERQAELRVTFDNMGDGVMMFGADKKLAAWNRNLQEMLDLPDSLLLDRPSFADLFRYLAERGEFDSADLEAELRRSVEDTNREMRYERTRPDGRVVEVRRNPVPDGGFVLIYADITERKHAEEAIRTARDAAEAALRDLQTAQDRLIQTEKLASLGQLTAGIAHEIKNPLNFVNNFSALTAELTDELNDLLKPAPLDDKMRGEADELTGMIKDNLEKVVQHGKRADSIVKNMLLHSREGSREHRPADINSLLDESLNLAYHGARAEKGEFNITLQRDFDPDAGTIELFPQEITRAFLNLIANGVYAATRRKTENKEPGFEPTLRAATKNLGTTVEIRIRDNGTGIPAEVREKMFNPFFTTKPAGQGTGLGLSMTHDIIVKQHGGRIDVATEPGQFTEFTVVLPRKSNLSGGDRGKA